MRFGIGCFWNGARTGLVIVLFVLLALVAHGAWGAASPRLEIEAPPELAAAGRQVSELATLDLEAFQALLGLEAPGLPIRVILVPETAELARKVPPWITGFARSGESLVVLFPERVPSYPHSSLPELVRHEI
ncbi:MAG: hypothetical protein OEM62_09810, partial [Acidobacteriota bacterium]|nr:hypothetical protein [Acidobacteriota bacterium]